MNRQSAVWIVFILFAGFLILIAAAFTARNRQPARVSFVIPAESDSACFLSDVELFPYEQYITVRAGPGMNGSKFFVIPANKDMAEHLETQEEYFLKTGETVRIALSKQWHRIGLITNNPTKSERTLYFVVKGATARVSNETNTLESYKTESVRNLLKVCAIAQRLHYPADYQYQSVSVRSKDPHSLKIFLEGTKPVSEVDFRLPAKKAFDLIGDLQIISFYRLNHPDVKLCTIYRVDVE